MSEAYCHVCKVAENHLTWQDCYRYHQQIGRCPLCQVNERHETLQDCLDFEKRLVVRE